MQMVAPFTFNILGNLNNGIDYFSVVFCLYCVAFKYWISLFIKITKRETMFINTHFLPCMRAKL